MTKEHFQIFVFFHSFWLSVKLNWIKKSDDEIKFEKFVKKSKDQSDAVVDKKKLAQKENEIQILSVLTNSLKIARQQTDVPITLHTHSHLPKPKFMSINNWLSCIQLEKTLPKIYSGLAESLAKEGEKWCEYFHYTDITTEDDHSIKNETKFDIDFLNDCPLKNESLNTFYKFVLWTTAQSNRLIELVDKFNVYNFGGIIPEHRELDIDQFYQVTSQFKPNLVMTHKNSKKLNLVFLYDFLHLLLSLI
jgi:hypothetical protein